MKMLAIKKRFRGVCFAYKRMKGGFFPVVGMDMLWKSSEGKSRYLPSFCLFSIGLTWLGLAWLLEKGGGGGGHAHGGWACGCLLLFLFFIFTTIMMEIDTTSVLITLAMVSFKPCNQFYEKKKKNEKKKNLLFSFVFSRFILCASLSSSRVMSIFFFSFSLWYWSMQ